MKQLHFESSQAFKVAKTVFCKLQSMRSFAMNVVGISGDRTPNPKCQPTLIPSESKIRSTCLELGLVGLILPDRKVQSILADDIFNQHSAKESIQPSLSTNSYPTRSLGQPWTVALLCLFRYVISGLKMQTIKCRLTLNFTGTI